MSSDMEFPWQQKAVIYHSDRSGCVCVVCDFSRQIDYIKPHKTKIYNLI